MDIFDVIFIAIIVVLGCIMFAIYKLAKYFIMKCRSTSIKMFILRIVMIIISLLFLYKLFIIGEFLYENPRIKDPDYDRGAYSIVFHNTTGVEISEINVWVGDNRVCAGSVKDIKQGEYRKFTIYTHEGEFIDSIMPPYNVYVNENEFINKDMVVGYFGIDTGGFELVNIIENNDGTFEFVKQPHGTNQYIKADRIDKRDQKLLSWF